MGDKSTKKSSRLGEIAQRQISFLNTLLHHVTYVPSPSAETPADISSADTASANTAPVPLYASPSIQETTLPAPAQTTPLSTYDAPPDYTATTHSDALVYSEKSPEITTPVIAEPPLKNTTHFAANTPNTLKPIQSRLRSGALATLLAPTYRLLQLNQALLSVLPADYHAHSTLVRLDTNAFIIQTDSSAWATRLRFKLPDVMNELSQQVGFTVPRPRIRVTTAWQTRSTSPAPNPPRRLQMSSETAQLLETAALGCPDKRLADAFKRLARHARFSQ